MTNARDQPLSSDEMLRQAREQQGAASGSATGDRSTEQADHGSEPPVASIGPSATEYAEEAPQHAGDAAPRPVQSSRRKVGEGAPAPATTGYPIEPVASGDESRKRFDWVHFLFRFDGRINRAKFWLGVGIQYLFLALLFLIRDGTNSQVGQALYVLGFVPLIWVSAAVAIKRWHDRDKSGWWVLIAFVPFIGAFWAIIEPGFLRGDDGSNKYGPDPLAAQQLPDESPVPPVRSRWRKVGVGVAAVVGLAVVGVLVGDDEAVTTYNEGVEMAEEGRWEDAVVANTEVIESDPSDTDLLARAYGNRSFSLAQLGRFEEALADATAVIQLEPDDTDTLAIAYVNRSRALIELGRFEEALADATAVIQLEPDDTDTLAQAYLVRSFALSELGRAEEALADDTAAIELVPDTVELLARAHFFRAVDLAAIGRVNEIAPDLERVLELLPSGHELYQSSNELLIAVGQDQADRLLQEATTASDSGSWDEAISILTELIDRDDLDSGTLSLALIERAAAYASNGRGSRTGDDLDSLQDALDDLERARELANSDRHLAGLALRTRAITQSYFGDFEAAIADARAADELERGLAYDVSYALLDWTGALEEQGRYELEVDAATAAIAIGFPNNDDLMVTHLNLGSGLDLAGRDEESIGHSTIAIEMGHPARATLALAHLNRAGALADLGRTDEALADSIVGRDLTEGDNSSWGRQVHTWALEQIARWERLLSTG